MAPRRTRERRSQRSRKMTTALATLLSVGLLVSGCSSADSGDASPTEAAGDGLLPAAEGKTRYPLTLETPWGSTTLEKRPERIAVTGTTADTPNVLALGVTPVYTAATYEKQDWVSGHSDLSKIEYRVDPVGGHAPLESVAAADPDLIVGIQTAQIEGDFNELSAIAPVLTGKAPGTGVSWEDSIRIIGEALDLQDKADGVLRSIHEQLDSTIADHPDLKGQSLVVLMQHPSEGLQVRSGAESAFASIISRLGMTVPESLRNSGGQGSVALPRETFAHLDADNIIIFCTEEQRRELEKDSLFMSIPAVEDGKYAFFDQKKYASATLWPDALSIPFAVENVLDPALETFAG